MNRSGQLKPRFSRLLLGCLSGPSACFTHAASGHYYRPLFAASMMASFHAFEGAPGPMHAENVGWFALELGLAIARRVFGSTHKAAEERLAALGHRLTSRLLPDATAPPQLAFTV